MPKLPRLALCLLIAPAVVWSGCGSTETASTSTTAAASTTASAPATTSPQATSTAPSATSTAAQPTTTTAAPKGTETKPGAGAKPQSEARAGEKHATATKPSANATTQTVPAGKQYPKYMRRQFLTSCTALKTSPASCECLLAKFELSPVEKLESAAELVVAIEDVRLGRTLPVRIQRQFIACKFT